jgi:hypothetical protein
MEEDGKMKMKRLATLSVLALTLAVSPVSAFAQQAPAAQQAEQVPVPQNYTVVHEAKGDPNAKVSFVDSKLAGSAGPEARGIISEAYDSSYYVVDSNNITSYNIGPIDSQKFLLSVATGQTKTLNSATSISGTVTYSGGVSVEIKNLINLSLTSSISGTISYTWGTTDQYTGPNSPYLHRDYYGANQYDQYENKVHRYDIYKIYNGGIYQYNETRDAGVTSIYAKKPKQITYSMDF